MLSASSSLFPFLEKFNTSSAGSRLKLWPDVAGFEFNQKSFLVGAESKMEVPEKAVNRNLFRILSRFLKCKVNK